MVFATAAIFLTNKTAIHHNPVLYGVNVTSRGNHSKEATRTHLANCFEVPSFKDRSSLKLVKIPLRWVTSSTLQEPKNEYVLHTAEKRFVKHIHQTSCSIASPMWQAAWTSRTHPSSCPFISSTIILCITITAIISAGRWRM